MKREVVINRNQPTSRRTSGHTIAVGGLNMWNDPIVDETRKIRDEIAARFNYDVEALGCYYQSQQAREGRVTVKSSAKGAKTRTETVSVRERSGKR